MRYAMQGEYIIWIMISTVGLLQALAAHYHWVGLSLFRGRAVLGYLCAAILVPGSYYWFFSYRERNVEGLEGWQLFSRFVIGAALGLAAVLVLSSLLNARRRLAQDASSPHVETGVDALRESTYAGLWAGHIARTVRDLRLRRGEGGAERE